MDVEGEYECVLSGDEQRFGGWGNVKEGGRYFTTGLEWNGRKNWVQVCLFSWFSRIKTDIFSLGGFGRCMFRLGRVSCLRKWVKWERGREVRIAMELEDEGRSLVFFFFSFFILFPPNFCCSLYTWEIWNGMDYILKPLCIGCDLGDVLSSDHIHLRIDQ